MLLTDEGYVLRIFIKAGMRHEHLPLEEWICRSALDAGLAGATVMTGTLGFGATSRASRSGFARLSPEAPIVIELVDGRQKLEHFIETIESAVVEGLAVLEKLEICFYRTAPERQL